MDFFGQNFELLVFEDKVFEQMPNFSSNQLAEIDCNNYRERREGEKRKVKESPLHPQRERLRWKKIHWKKQVLPKGLFACESIQIQSFCLFKISLRELLFLSIMVYWKIGQNNCVERWTDE